MLPFSVMMTRFVRMVKTFSSRNYLENINKGQHGTDSWPTPQCSDIFSRPGQSQQLLYKQPGNSFINSVSHPFSPTALRRRHAPTVRASTSGCKIDYVIVIKNFLNPEGHRNPFCGSKVTAILLEGWILPIGGASAVEGLPHLVHTPQRLQNMPFIAYSGARHSTGLGHVCSRLFSEVVTELCPEWVAT